MPAGQASSAGLDNLPAIRNAILDIALNKSGLVWWGHSVGELPEHLQVQGFPYLAVDNGKTIGSVIRGEFQPGRLMRQPEQSEPVYSIKVYALFPYHPGDTKTYSTPDLYRQALVNAFTIYWTAENQAQEIAEDDIFMGSWQLRSSTPKYYAVIIAVRALDWVPVDYQPS